MTSVSNRIPPKFEIGGHTVAYDIKGSGIRIRQLRIQSGYCCPSSVQDAFSGGFYRKDALTEFFDEVGQRCKFKYWFFGHYHEDMVVEKKYVMLYEQIIRLKL